MKLIALTLAAFFSSIPEVLAADDPNCVKYIYADLRNKKDGVAGVFACRKIENNKARNCSKIGTLNVDKLEEKKTWAMRQMVAYGAGYSAGTACMMSVGLLPLGLRGFKPWANLAVRADRTRAQSATARNAYDRVMANTREPGSMPVRDEKGEIIQHDYVTQGCRWAAATVTNTTRPRDISFQTAYNLGYDTVLANFRSNAQLNATWKGDYAAILARYPDEKNQQHIEARREAVKRMQARIDQEIANQEKILAEVIADAKKLYAWATDGPTTLFMGYSPDNVSNDLKCIAGKEQEIQQMLCKLATSEGKISNYRPGDAFTEVSRVTSRGLEGAEQQARTMINENCRTSPSTGEWIDKSLHDVEITPPYP